MKIIFYFFLGILLSSPAVSQVDQKLSGSIDLFMEECISNYDMPGISLAIMKDGTVIHRNTYGYANLEHEVKIKEGSIFRVYSITKIFVATAIMQLVEAGQISLEDEITSSGLDLPESWKSRKIKHLLSHSTGFPDMAPIPEFQNLSEEEAYLKVTQQELKAESGLYYDYNQTNFYILQKIIEKVTKMSLSDYIVKNQFSSAEGNAFFSTDSREIVKNRVTPYFPFSTGERIIDHSYLQGSYFDACNGMNISMEAFIKWDQSFRNNEFISNESRKKLLSTFDYEKSKKEFTYGFDKRTLNKHDSYGFSGSLVTAYRFFPEDDISIILLSNGCGDFFDIEDIVNQLAHLVDNDIIDLEKEASEKLKSYLDNSQVKMYEEAMQSYIQSDKYSEVDFESIGNSLGYYMLRMNRLEDAIKVFQVNVAEFPESWNVYDSLGEAYMIGGNYELSKKNYLKSLELNPDNEYGRAALKKMADEK